MKKPWFRAKKYGWGWGLPLTWQGWLVLLGYILFLVWDLHRTINSPSFVSDAIMGFSPDLVMATLIFIFIAYLTGEKPKWRWGGK
jgi:hypothetical protein